MGNEKLFQIFINGDSCRTPFIEGYSNSFIREQFALKYPCVFEIIEEVKSNNEQLYYKLSKIESEFIFEIVRDLYTQYPQTKILIRLSLTCGLQQLRLLLYLLAFYPPCEIMNGEL